MTDLLSRPIVPVANEEDAKITYERFRPYLLGDEDVDPLVVTVIDKAGGAPDKAGVEQRQALAESTFDTIRALANADGIDVECELLYGTDVAETIIETAENGDASAIVFTSRGGGTLSNFLSGSVRTKLVTESHTPVLVLPNQ